MKSNTRNWMHDIAAPYRKRARRTFRRALMGLFAFVIGVTGLGFLTASGYILLCDYVAPIWAALFIGLGALVVSGGLLALASRAKPSPKPDPAPKPTDDVPSTALPMMAFTAAFVLARLINRGKHD